MNTKKIIGITVLALIIGIGIGYLLFSVKGNNTDMVGDGHQHTATGSDQKSGEKAEIWTCSMHPQIRQNEPGICPICNMDLIPLDQNASNDPLVLKMTEEAIKLAQIQTTTIGRAKSSSQKKEIVLSGKIQADERRIASQVAHIPGRIEKLYVTFTGEKIKAGQELAQIYSPELVLAQNELIEAIKLRDINPKMLEVARNKLKRWKISEYAINRIERDQTVQELFTLVAESDGVVAERKVAVGDYVKQGEVLFELVDLNKLWGIFDAYEEDLANIKVGDKIVFTTPSIPSRKFTTYVSFIDPVFNAQTRTAALRTELENYSGKLKPEMLLNGTLQSIIYSAKALTVPKSAVLWTGKRSVVYVKMPNTDVPSYQYRDVTLGESLGEKYLITEGLKAGEEVVTYGSFALDAAAQLNNQKSMMNKDVKIKKEDILETKSLPDFTKQSPLVFKKQLGEATTAYLALKDALVETDANKSSELASTFLSKIKDVDMSLLQGKSHDYWMKQQKDILSHTQSITKSSNVEKQRKDFGFVSDRMIEALRVMGHTKEDLYVQYCPMAFDDDGAYWLSNQKKVLNPYFGEKMLKCGLVKDSLMSKNK